MRRNSLGLRFRRQHPLGPYILDFYCPGAKLCVEIDGPTHAEQQTYDAKRTRWLASSGIRVLRLSAEAVLNPRNQARILAAIAQAAGAPSTGSAGPPPP